MVLNNFFVLKCDEQKQNKKTLNTYRKKMKTYFLFENVNMKSQKNFFKNYV